MTPTAEPADIAVIGGGALGGLSAAFLEAVGHRVTLCLRTPVPELTVRTGGGTRTPRVRLATEPDTLDAPVDWVLLTTKIQDTAGAAGWLRALCGPHTAVAVVQNGVDHADRVAPLLPPGTPVLPVLAYVAVERVAPGRIVHYTGDQLRVPAGGPADRFAALFAGSGLRVDPAADFRTAVWQKMLTNVAANPLTALLQQRLGVFRDAETRALGADILREAVAVARAEGAAVGEADVERTLATLAAAPPDGGTSMLYDRLAGRRLEHEHITGAVVRAGERHGVPTPLNRMLLVLLRALDRGPRTPREGAAAVGAADGAL